MRRVLLHSLIALYLLLSFSALAQTMSHRVPPFVPAQMQYFFYGMMAPYQGYSTENFELRAEGLLPDGTWESIDLHPYMPFIFGERNARMYRTSVRRLYGEGETLTAFYRRTAEDLLRLERASGRPYDELRLWWDVWPVSPEGFYALRVPAFTDSKILVTVP